MQASKQWTAEKVDGLSLLLSFPEAFPQGSAQTVHTIPSAEGITRAA